MLSKYWLLCPSTGYLSQVRKCLLSMLICAEMRGMYDAKMIPYVVYKPTKLEKKVH